MNLHNLIEKNYNYVIIFQDDVLLRNNFCEELNKVLKDVPKDAELINIAFHKFASYSTFVPWDLNEIDNSMIKLKVSEGICRLQDTVNPCSLGYIVTLNGAKNLITHFNRTGFLRATDWNYNDYLRSKNIFYGSNVVLCTGNPDFGSDIFI